MLAKKILINLGLLLGAIAFLPYAAVASERPAFDMLLIRLAASTDQQASQQAIATLRESKNFGVEDFLRVYQQDLPNNPRLRAVLDEICQQKDCDASRLYWYKDLEAAKLESKATGKPILSLHLLGNLNDELSCANSRFFRTSLYPNAVVSKLLRDRFILHWQSERPVPKVTIDFGDGRKLEQTLTGNSVHYVLDSDGNPIDAIPGLYSPQAFMENLKDAENVVRSLGNSDLNNNSNLRREILVKYHRDRLTKLEKAWQADLTRLRLPAQPLLRPMTATSGVTAIVASRLTLSKSAVELPILSSADRQVLAEVAPPSPFAKLSDQNWARLARLYQNRVYLDQGSLKLMERKLPPSVSMANVVKSFESAIAQDTVRNEYVFHAQIHNWFANGEFGISEFGNGDSKALTALNRRVYDQLFLTPANDPWLGLLNENDYTGNSK